MFGQLPSYVLANGTLFDLQVANALAEWENDLLNPNKTSVPELSQEQMLSMIKSVKERQ